MTKLDHGKNMNNDVIGTNKDSWSGVDLQENSQKFRELIDCLLEPKKKKKK